MTNVVVSFSYPTTKGNGAKPLALSEIASVSVELSADGGTTFGLIGTVVPPDTTFTQTDLEPGTWVFGLTVNAKSGKSSTRKVATATIQALAPDEVQNITLTLV